MDVGQRPTLEEKRRGVNTAGNFVFIEDFEGRLHRYLHLKSVNSNLSSGIQVSRGDLIGWSNDTGDSGGPHLHYDLNDGNYIDPTQEFDC